MADNQVVVELLLANNQYLAKLSESQQKTNSAVKNIATNLSGMKSAIAGSAILKALDYMVLKANAAEDAQEKLNLRIKTTEGIAGVSAQAINKYSEELSKASVYGKTALVQMSTDLLKFTNIHTNEFKGAMQAVVDYASETGDLSGAAQTVGRALQNPANAARALRAANITLSTSQQQLINKFISTGDVASAQKIILEKFTQIYGGKALLDAQDYEGALEKMKNTMNSVVAQGATPLMRSLTDLFNSTNKLTETAGINVFAEALKACLSPIKLFIDYAAKSLELINKLYEKWEKFRGLNVSAFDAVMNSMPAAKSKAGPYEIIKPKGEGSSSPIKPNSYSTFDISGIGSFADFASQKDYSKYLTDLANKTQNFAEKQKLLKAAAEASERSIKSLSNGIYGAAEYITQMSGQINDLFNIISDNAIQLLETKKTQIGALFDFMEQRALQSAGLQEETAAQHAEKEISQLQKQMSKTSTLAQKRALREQIIAKQKEKTKADIEEKSAKRKQALDLYMDILEMQMKRKQFERNKAYQLSMLWINTAAAITAAWLAAWQIQSSGGVWAAAIAMGAISTALMLANAGVQTGLISQQKPPAYATGSWDVQTTGPAILHGGEIVTPKPIADSIRSGDAYLGAGSAGGDIVMVMDGRQVGRVTRDRNSRFARNIGGRSFSMAGAY